jgi:hypothetical protein
VSRSGFSGVDSSITGSLILYFSLDQLPRSSNLHRSLQKGNSSEVSESTGLRHIGHCHFIPREYRNGPLSQVFPGFFGEQAGGQLASSQEGHGFRRIAVRREG